MITYQISKYKSVNPKTRKYIANPKDLCQYGIATQLNKSAF